MDRPRPTPKRSQSDKTRTGFTTGANACAASVAAATLLLGEPLEDWTGPLPDYTADRYDELAGAISIHIPNGDRVTFPVRVARLEAPHTAYVSVIKDAGDDPDCTHRAEIWARVTLDDSGEVTLLRGEGVGVVTRPGLGIPVGEPSITAPPRENIRAEVLRHIPEGMGAQVTVGIINGEELSKKTLNARLGIVGGLSILGTSGIVRPYSTAAFRASVVQAIDVAREQGLDEVVLTTGGRSERFAMETLPHLSEQAFVQMGDFVGAALTRAAKREHRRVTIAAMMGKLSKMAAGTQMTHAKGSKVDMDLLAGLAAQIGAPESLRAAILEANTGRHVQELVTTEGVGEAFFAALCERVSVMQSAHLQGRFEAPPTLDVLMFDFGGALLGAHRPTSTPREPSP